MILPPKSNFDLDLKYGDIMAANAHKMFIGGKIEVKAERIWHQTLNACFEVLRYDNTKTGILSTLSTDWHQILSQEKDELKPLLSLTFPTDVLKWLIKDRLIKGRGRVQRNCGDNKRTTCVLINVLHLIPGPDFVVTNEVKFQRRFNAHDELTKRVIEYLK